MKSKNRLRVGIVSLAAIMALSGCVAQSAPEATSTPLASPQPTKTVAVETVIDRPEPRTEIDCDAILTPSEAESLIAAGVQAQPVLGAARTSSPLTSAVLNLGALACEWGNMPLQEWWMPNDGYRGASLKIVPVTEQQWELYGPEPGYEDPAYPGVMISIPDEKLWSWCWALDEYRLSSSCYAEGIVNGFWISFESSGLGDDVQLTTEELHARLRPMLDRTVSGLNAQTASEVWASNETQWALPNNCDAYLSVEQGAELAGVELYNIGSAWDGPRKGFIWLAMKELGSAKCDLLLKDSEALAASITAMNQGSWRVRELNELRLASGDATPVSLSGLGDQETSALRCANAELECTIDMSFRGHWLQVAVSPTRTGSGAFDHEFTRNNIVEIAETMLGNLAAVS